MWTVKKGVARGVQSSSRGMQTCSSLWGEEGVAADSPLTTQHHMHPNVLNSE